ncbi:hypothetical protein [Allofournierella massiliensis]|uniref:Uncharacterized protein n=1 Tax=Allofournierella massiliensis TaxID=1650663 RepID=A0A4R1R5Q1_9FIRM|nr:hypothetical protein [Fournierella massiliensis]TCL60839.1 hypothetical protein EDD77_103164 [Fournierella massiliensis]
MKRKNMATMATCIALVGAVAVGGTLALLSTGPKTLNNTFTVGSDFDDTDFLLKENNATQQFISTDDYNYGSYIKGSDVIVGNEAGSTGVRYDNIVADTTLDKNPWFELDKDANDKATIPDAWIVAKIDGLTELNGKGITIDENSESTGWKVVTVSTNPKTQKKTYTLGADVNSTNLVDGAYFVYTTKLDADSETNYKTNPLFTKLYADSNVESLNTEFDLTVTGVAVQALKGDTVMDNDTLQAVMEALPAGFINAK